MDAFRNDLACFEQAIAACIADGVLKQHQFDALVSFSFKAGVGAFQKSTLVKKINLGDFEGAAGQSDVGHIPPEITSRRNGEREQFKDTAFKARI